MSGGSFNYACFKVGDSEIFKALGDIKGIERYLRSIGKQEAADEVFRFVLECEVAQRRLNIMGDKISELLRAAEWVASSDYGVEAIDRAYDEYVGHPRG
jgi:hypothetical protein